MSKRPPFFRWRKAILDSDLASTTKHVLLTLSCHMTDSGESCFPSVEQLGREASLSKRAVMAHLKIAVELGWVRVEQRGYRGQRWKRNQYWPVWQLLPNVGDPDQAKAVNEGNRVCEEGGDPGDAKAVTADNQDKSTSKSTSVTTTAPRARVKSRTETTLGTRVDVETLPAEWHAFCASERPDLDPEQTFNSFRDYWIGVPGRAGRKLDWAATWRNWVRKERRYAQTSQKLSAGNVGETERRRAGLAAAAAKRLAPGVPAPGGS